jgi:glycerophosphoryl diester phosphodiesterase
VRERQARESGPAPQRRSARLGRALTLAVALACACSESSVPPDAIDEAGAGAEPEAGRDATAPEPEPEPPCLPPVLFGHRGTTLHRPENTLPAFQWAIDEGGDGIEVDVRLSADRELVVIHDSRTGRTTDDSADRRVADLTVAELKTLDAGAWFEPPYPGTRVPTLREVVEAFPDPEVLLLLDMKGDGAGPATVAAIRELDIAERSLMSSFDEAVLAEVHAELPDVPIVYFLDAMDEVARAPETGATYLRIPDDVQSDPTHMQTVIDAGYLPAVGGTWVQWNGSLGLANSMPRTVERRRERRPAHCEE